MRTLACTLLVIAGCHRGGGQITDLSLNWVGVNGSPRASAAVAESFAAAPIRFTLRDVRPDPTMVGRYEDDGFVVRTSANVGQYAGAHMAEMLTRAGARLNEQPVSTVDAELVELQVVEGGTYTGLARIRVIVSHGPNGPWAKIYEGKSKRWGRTHNQENFNEALSNALESATSKMLEDDEFAHAVLADAPPPPPPGGGS